MRRPALVLVLLVIGSLAAWAADGDAATVAAAEKLQPTSEKVDFLDHLFTWHMAPLWLASLVLVTLIFERFRALRAGGIIDPAMIDTVTRQLRAGDLASAQRTCAKSDTMLGRAWADGFKEVQYGTDIHEALTDNTLLGLKPLRRNIMAMTTIGVISPLFGLFATVLGIIMSFSQMGAAGGADKGKLAVAVGVALFGTAGGILAAIPAIIMSRFFAGKVTRFADDAELAIHKAAIAWNQSRSGIAAPPTLDEDDADEIDEEEEEVAPAPAPVRRAGPTRPART